MPGLNLTRFEANSRTRNIKNVKYYISLDLMEDGDCFESITSIEFNAKSGTSTFIDLVAKEVYSITFNNETIDTNNYKDYRIEFSNLQETNRVVIRAKMKYSKVGEGLHKYQDPVDKEVYLYSQFEVPDSRQVFAVFEQPDIKAVYNFTITAPSRWQVWSTSPSIDKSRATWADTSKEEASIWNFSPTPKLSSYVTGIVAGPYYFVEDKLINGDGREIPLKVACRQSVKESLDYEEILDLTKAGFKFYSDTFDYPYPYAKYDQIFVPEFNAGAMENVGLVTYTDSYVFTSKVPKPLRERRAVTILHELAHMWFGDLVTMKWWNDLWLNESFAEYMSTLATAEATKYSENWVTFNTNEKTRAVFQDALPTTHPIAATINNLEDVQVNFDMITYAKGASVLKHLVSYVGRETFFKGINSYLRKYSYSNASLSDLLAELEKASGLDLKSWCLVWLESAGTNTLSLDATVQNSKYTNFNIIQSYPDEYPITRPHKVGIGFYNFTNSKKIEKTKYLEVNIDTETSKIDELIGSEVPDLLLLNDNDLTFTKIVLDDKSLECAKNNVQNIEDSLTRSLIMNSLWDMTQAKKLKLDEYFKVIETALKTETNQSIIKQQILNLGEMANLYIGGDKRREFFAKLSRMYYDLAISLDDEDSILQYVNAMCNFACDDELVKEIENLYKGNDSKIKVELDLEMKWQLIGSLINNNKITEQEVKEFAKENDNQVSIQYLAKTLSQIPTKENKEEVFNKLYKDDMTNAITRWTSVGYLKSLEENVFEKTAYSYFDNLIDIWNNKEFQIAEQLIEGTYPFSFVNQEFLEYGEKWLNDNKRQPEALLRLVKENVWWTKHALEMREFNV